MSERAKWLVGGPGPTLEDCEVLERRGDEVKIRYQVFGKGPFFEKWVPSRIVRPIDHTSAMLKAAEEGGFVDVSWDFRRKNALEPVFDKRPPESGPKTGE